MILLSQQLGMPTLQEGHDHLDLAALHGFAAQITTLKGEKTSLQQQILGVLLGSANFTWKLLGKPGKTADFGHAVSCFLSINIHHPIWGRNFEPWQI